MRTLTDTEMHYIVGGDGDSSAAEIEAAAEFCKQSNGEGELTTTTTTTSAEGGWLGRIFGIGLKTTSKTTTVDCDGSDEGEEEQEQEDTSDK